MARYISVGGQYPLEVIGLVYEGTEASQVQISAMVGPMYSIEATDDEGAPSLVIHSLFDEVPDQIVRKGEYVFKSELGVFSRAPTVFETVFKKK